MEEIKSQDGGAQPTPTEEEKPTVDENVTPAKEENVDEEEDLSEYGVPPMPSEEEEREEPGEKPEKESQEEETAETDVELPKIAPPEPRVTRLDRRLADRYIHNLHLMGETKIPTEEEVIDDLKKYSREEKIQALHFHLQQEKKMRGEKPTGNDFEEEDVEAIRDAEREAIRQEIITEENEKQVMQGFVEFLDKHTELLPDTPEYKERYPEKSNFNPRLAKAVETLWKGGMPIAEAYETVTDSITSAKTDKKKEAELKKQKILSGSVSATNDSAKSGKKMTWSEFDRLRTEDPDRYEKLLDEGYQPSEE